MDAGQAVSPYNDNPLLSRLVPSIWLNLCCILPKTFDAIMFINSPKKDYKYPYVFNKSCIYGKEKNINNGFFLTFKNAVKVRVSEEILRLSGKVRVSV